MNSSELNEAFRSGLGSEKSLLFSERDVWRFANEAYRSYARLIGGIPDFTSTACQVAQVAGQAISALDPSILRITTMTRRSDYGNVEVINYTDVSKLRQSDYGKSRPIVMDNRQGEVRYGVIGMEKNKIRWINVPAVDDVVDLGVYRLPKTIISKPGQDLDEIEEQHHLALLSRMYALASASPLISDINAAALHDSSFAAYCAKVRGEISRYKAKGARTVTYGGL